MRPLEVAGGKEAQALGLGHLRRRARLFAAERGNGEAREGRGGVARDAAPRYSVRTEWSCSLTTKLVWYYSSHDPDRLEPMYRPFMRTVDLLVRHGARSSAADSDARFSDYDYMNAWICTRADCTPQILEATRRGDLAFDWPRRPGD